MLKAIARIVRTPDLLRKIAFTLGLIAVYRMGAFVPAPGVDYPAVQQCLAAGNAQGGLYSFVNMFSGGALLQVSVFALGIMPYITASIIVQLLRVVIPRFEQLHQEGPQGQATLTQYTRYLTLALALRAVLECAGIHDVLSKSMGSVNAINIVRGTVDALKKLEEPQAVAARRGKALDEIAPHAMLRTMENDRAQKSAKAGA